MTAIAPQNLDARLTDVQARIRSLEAQAASLDRLRDEGRQECDRLVRRCNEIHAEVQPLLDREGRLIKWNNVARYAGLGSGGCLGLGAGLATFSPLAGMCVFGATVAVLAAAFFATEYTRKHLREIRPEINNQVQSWKYNEQQLRREESRVKSLAADARALEQPLREARGQEEVLLVARGVSRTPVPGQNVRDDSDTVLIGDLRVPKRAKGAENIK